MKSIKLQGMILAIILILFPSLITTSYFFFEVKNKLVDNANENISFYIDIFTKEATSGMDKIKNTAMLILSSEDVIKALESEQDFVSYSMLQEEISDLVNYNYSWDKKYINGLFIFKDEKNYVPIFRSATNSSISRNKQVFNDYNDYKSFNSLVKPNRNDDYAYYILDIYDNSSKRLGKLIIEVDLSAFVDETSIRKIYPNAEVFITDKYNRTLYSTTDKTYKTPESFAASSGEDNLMFSSKTKYNISFHILAPKNYIFGSTYKVIIVYIVLVIFSLAIAFFLTAFAYKKLLKPYKEMEKNFIMLGQGDFSVRLETTHYKETNIIVNTFNNMADNIEDLFYEVYEKGRELSKVELLMLQSQINPHFLFNVLEVINMRAAELGANNICKMIQNLAKLIRSNITLKGQDKITLQQELDYATYYLILQKERFGDRLNYYINIEDDELLKTYIPKLLIQPLVENSVVHGIEPMNKDGQVLVSIWEEDDMLWIKISDTGIGFDTQNIKNNKEKHNNLALNNIKRRLQLLYADKCDFIIKSEAGKGTNIIISIPIEYNK